MVVVSGLKNFAAQDNTTVYDRYVYLAMVGPAFVVAALTSRWQARWQLAIGTPFQIRLLALSFTLYEHAH